MFVWGWQTRWSISIGNPLYFSIYIEFCFLNVCTAKINLGEIWFLKFSQSMYNKQSKLSRHKVMKCCSTKIQYQLKLKVRRIEAFCNWNFIIRSYSQVIQISKHYLPEK